MKVEGERQTLKIGGAQILVEDGALGLVGAGQIWRHLCAVLVDSLQS